MMEYLFFFVSFVGIAFMFFCIMRRQDAILRILREDRAWRMSGAEPQNQSGISMPDNLPSPDTLEFKNSGKPSMPDINM